MRLFDEKFVKDRFGEEVWIMASYLKEIQRDYRNTSRKAKTNDVTMFVGEPTVEPYRSVLYAIDNRTLDRWLKDKSNTYVVSSMPRETAKILLDQIGKCDLKAAPNGFLNAAIFTKGKVRLVVLPKEGSLTDNVELIMNHFGK